MLELPVNFNRNLQMHCLMAQHPAVGIDPAMEINRFLPRIVHGFDVLNVKEITRNHSGFMLF
jgi:hypothetical protein